MEKAVRMTWGLVEDAGLQEDGWGVGDEGCKSGELDGTDRGEAARQELEWGVGDEGSRSGELGGTGSGDAGQRELGWGVGDEVGGAE